MTMIGFKSAFDTRSRLLSLVQAHPNFARSSPPAAGQFPHDIVPYDVKTVDEKDDVQCCLVVPGQNIEEYSLGPGGVGKMTLMASVLALVYVYIAPVDPVTVEDVYAETLAREALLGQLTNSLLEAILSFPVDPTPGDQMWNILRLAPTAIGLQTTYYTSNTFHQSKTRLNLFGQMTRPGGAGNTNGTGNTMAGPSGTLSS